MAELETEVKLLKKELQDQAKIHSRLDIAIEKLTDVSNSIHRMLAVHEEKIPLVEKSSLHAPLAYDGLSWRHQLIFQLLCLNDHVFLLGLVTPF